MTYREKSADKEYRKQIFVRTCYVRLNFSAMLSIVANTGSIE
jgi:hypothetical protein